MTAKLTINKVEKGHLAHPIRRCAACRVRQNAADLLHFVKDGDALVLTLSNGSSIGRSLYLCADKNCLLKFKEKIGKSSNKQEMIAAVYQQLERAVALRSEELDRVGNDCEGSPARKQLSSKINLMVKLRNQLTIER